MFNSVVRLLSIQHGHSGLLLASLGHLVLDLLLLLLVEQTNLC